MRAPTTGWETAFERKLVEVRLVGDTVQISYASKLFRTHAARHEKDKEDGVFSFS